MVFTDSTQERDLEISVFDAGKHQDYNAGERKKEKQPSGKIKCNPDLVFHKEPDEYNRKPYVDVDMFQ